MIKNMGYADRILRLLLVGIIVTLYAMGYLSGTLSLILLVFAGVLFLTSLAGTCPLYYPFRISTRSKSPSSDEGMHHKESSV